MRINRRSAAALALIAGIALSQSVVASAFAEDTPYQIEFTNTSQTIEYGQYWGFPVAVDFNYYILVYGGDQNYDVTGTGIPSGYKPSLYLGSTGGSTPSGWGGTLDHPYEAPPLGAGQYTFIISSVVDIGEGNTRSGKTPTPATLTIEKAKLGMELRVLADPQNSGGAIVTAKFTGRFVDEYSSSFFPGSAASPAGTWNIIIKDADGEVATERSVERAAGDDVLATSFYWDDAEPGEQYTASAAFVASGVSANNFSIGAAQNFSYTAPEAARPVPTSTATEKPDASLPEATGFGLPLWALILVIVLIVGLGVLVTILSVRLSRRPKPSAGEVQP